MGASAGGSNVGGVQSVESGTYTHKRDNTTLSVVGGETNNVVVTVPAGETWVLKFLGIFNTSLVGTISSQYITLLVDSEAIDVATGAGSSVLYTATQPITLKAGAQIRYTVTTSAWTSGQKKCITGYQKIIS